MGRKRRRGENEPSRLNPVSREEGVEDEQGSRSPSDCSAQKSRCGELWKNQQVLKRREPAGRETVLTAERQPSRRL